MIALIRTVINRALGKAFRCAAFYLAVEAALDKFVCNSQRVEAVATRMIGDPVFTVLVAKDIKREVAKSYFSETHTDERFNKLA